MGAGKRWQNKECCLLFWLAWYTFRGQIAWMKGLCSSLGLVLSSLDSWQKEFHWLLYSETYWWLQLSLLKLILVFWVSYYFHVHRWWRNWQPLGVFISRLALVLVESLGPFISCFSWYIILFLKKWISKWTALLCKVVCGHENDYGECL